MAVDETLQVAVVGTGFAGSAHVEALRRVPGVQVAAIAGSSDERAGAAAQALGIPRSTGDFRTLLADPAIDCIHDCTPNDLREVVTGAALDAGKHVLAEKPLGMDASQAAGLAGRAAQAGVISGVCFNYRHFPLVAEARAMLEDGRAGTPHLVRGGYLQDWLLDPTDWNWRLLSGRAGRSRALADIGSHWVDLAQHVTGRRITRVFAHLGRLHEVRQRPARTGTTFERGGPGGGEPLVVDTEDFATVLIELEGGCAGTFTVSQVTPGMRNRLTFEVDTAAVCVAWDQERPNVLWIGRRDVPNQQLLRDPGLLSPPAAALAHYPGGHQEGWADALKNLMLDFYASVRSAAHGQPRETSVASFADAHRVASTIDAILESDRRERWVALDQEP